MALKFFSLVSMGLFAANVWATACPNLSGHYWDVQSDKAWNHFMKIDQTGCTSIQVSFCTTLQSGTTACGTPIGGNLDGKFSCTDYGYCRSYSATPSEVVTSIQGTYTSQDSTHGKCSWNNYKWSQDANGNIVESTPISCTDGYKGNLVRTIEKY